MSESIKPYLVVLNRYDKKTDTPRIKTDFFILKAPGLPEIKDLKLKFKQAVLHAIRHTPSELNLARTNPEYKVTWADVHKLPNESLAEYNLAVYNAKLLPAFNNVIVLNVNDKATFNIDEIRGV